MKTQSVLFCIPKETAQDLEKYKKETMVPKSQLVSRLLREFLNNHNSNKQIKNKK
jgi:hypothetical protein